VNLSVAPSVFVKFPLEPTFVTTADTAVVYAPKVAAERSVFTELVLPSDEDEAKVNTAAALLVTAFNVEVAVMCFDVAGAEITFAATVIVSESSRSAANPTVTEVSVTAPARDAEGVPAVIDAAVRSDAAAEAGATEVNTPKPNAATATSAMRLKVVFVDICFLSISRVREFPDLGLNQISLIRFDESHVLIHQIPHRVSGRGEETYLFVFHLHCLR